MRRSPMFEALENRRLLSGSSVSATIAGDVITVNGDNKSNEFVITQDGTGYLFTGQNGTKINGLPAAHITSGAAHFVIDTGNGEDSVSFLFGNDPFAGVILTSSISTGNGKDTVTMAGVGVVTDLTIDTGNGDDTVNLTDVGLSNDLHVNTGNGADTVNLANNGYGVATFGTLYFDGGNGPDKITGTGVIFLGGVSIADFESIS